MTQALPGSPPGHSPRKVRGQGGDGRLPTSFRHRGSVWGCPTSASEPLGWSLKHRLCLSGQSCYPGQPPLLGIGVSSINSWAPTEKWPRERASPGPRPVRRSSALCVPPNSSPGSVRGAPAEAHCRAPSPGGGTRWLDRMMWTLLGLGICPQQLSLTDWRGGAN